LRLRRVFIIVVSLIIALYISHPRRHRNKLSLTQIQSFYREKFCISGQAHDAAISEAYIANRKFRISLTDDYRLPILSHVQSDDQKRGIQPMNRKFGIIVMVFFIMMYFTGALNAEFYEWVDEEGNVHISDKPVAQGNKVPKIKSRSGDNDAGGDSTSRSGSDEWFDCSERRYRAGVEAAELLEQEEGWSAKPVFESNVRQFADGFMLELHFSAKIPEHEIKALGCSYGYQTVKVKTEEDFRNRGQCRILSVALGAKRLEPPSCRK